jgi:RNA polymerase sigma factor (sigma-70 family)
VKRTVLHEGEDFAAVLDAARDGDAGAIEILYRSLHPAVLAYFRGQLPFDDAEDAAADAFIGMAKGLRSFSGSEAQFRSWVFTICHHRVVDERRKHARRRTECRPPEKFIDLVANGDAEQDALASVATSAALRRLDLLPPGQAEVIRLRVMADLSVADVADLLGKKPEAVRALQFRGLKRMARELAGQKASA